MEAGEITEKEKYKNQRTEEPNTGTIDYSAFLIAAAFRSLDIRLFGVFPMPIEFRCSQCGQLLRVPEEAAGKSARCPKCQALMHVPGVAIAVPPGGEPAPVPSPPPISSSADMAGSGAPPMPPPPGNPFSAAPPPTSFPPPPPKPPAESPFSSAAASQSLNPYASPGATDAAFTQFATGSLPIIPRPVSADTVFNYAWEIWKTHLGLLVGVTLLIAVLNYAVLIPFQILQFVLQQQGEEKAAIASSFVGQLAANVVQLYLGIGAVQINLKLARRQPATFNDLFRGGSLFLPLLGGAILAYIGLIVGAMLCIVPAILMLLAYWPFYFLIIDRKARVLDSFTIASQITKGNWASAFVLWLMSLGISILGCLALCIGIIFAAPLVSMMFAVAYLMMSGQILPYGSYPAYMPPPQPAPQVS
jgi:hypothetical protein